MFRKRERKLFKGTVAEALDAWYSKPPVRDNLELARRVLESPDDFTKITSDLHRDGKADPAFEYPRDDCEGGRALRGREFEAVMRKGYLKAIELAFGHGEEGVPIRTYWMTGAGNKKFEMHITNEVDHVSVTLLVPKVQGGSTVEGSPESWVVTVGRDGEPEPIQTSGPGTGIRR
jgi:hypothetical protein